MTELLQTDLRANHRLDLAETVNENLVAPLDLFQIAFITVNTATHKHIYQSKRIINRLSKVTLFKLAKITLFSALIIMKD